MLLIEAICLPSFQNATSPNTTTPRLSLCKYWYFDKDSKVDNISFCDIFLSGQDLFVSFYDLINDFVFTMVNISFSTVHACMRSYGTRSKCIVYTNNYV